MIASDNSSTRSGLGDSVQTLASVRVPLRDGLTLHAVAYLPRTQPSGVPTVVEFTPYTTDSVHQDGLWFASRGFAFVAVDVRGRGDSDGEFDPYVNDGDDGHDVLNWISDQPWSDGRTVLFGGSYTGGNQFLILATAPSSLRAISPASSSVSGIDAPQGGVPSVYDARWLQSVTGRTMKVGPAGDTPGWTTELISVMGDEESLWTMVERRGVAVTDLLRREVSQPWFGPHWEHGYLPNPAHYAGIDVPILTITGWYDDSIGGSLVHHARWAQYAPTSAQSRSHLLIGPWDHAGTRSGLPRVGDLEFAPAAAVDLNEVRYRWYRSVLFDDRLPELLSDPVVYYLAGSEEWRGSPTLGSATIGARELHPVATNEQSGPFNAGHLKTEPEAGPEVVVTLDPADLRTPILERQPRVGLGDLNVVFTDAYHSLGQHASGSDPTCESFVLELTDQGAVYHSAPLDSPVVMTGSPALRLRLVSDQPDADLLVLLYEVLPTGGTILLSSRFQRLSALTTPPVPLPVGQEVEVTIDSWRPNARTLRAGSRLRLVIRDAQSTLTPLRPGPAPVHLRLLHPGDATGPLLTIPLGRTVDNENPLT